MTNAYAPSILRQTLCRDSQFNKQNHHPMKRLKCICAVSAFLLFLGLFAPQVAWGQFKYEYSSGYFTTTPSFYTAVNSVINNGRIYLTSDGYIDGNNSYAYIEINKNITISTENPADYGRFRLMRQSNRKRYIQVSENKKLTIKNIILDGNNVEYVMPLICVKGTLEMVGESKTGSGYDPANCKIINCKKLDYEDSFTNGGAINVMNKKNTDTGGRLVCNSVTFENNESRDIHRQPEGLTYGGGAIAVHKGCTFTLTNCHFYNNTAYESGGAILLEYAGNSSIRDCTFGASGKPNTAYLGGGAIYGLMLNNNTLSIEGNTSFQYNQVVYNTTTGMGEPERMGLGGAACLITLSTRSSTFNIGAENSSNIVFNNNYARLGGGALVLWCANADARFKLCNFSMENNWTDCIGTDNESGGGALFVHGANSEGHSDDHFIIQNGVFRNNHSINYGGAMLIDMHDCKVENVTFESNYTTVSSNGRGGAVMIFGNETSYTHTNQFINCNFYKNGINGSTTTTEFGGAIYSVNKTNIQLLGCTVGGSEANANNANKAKGHGGGIFIGPNSYLTIDSYNSNRGIVSYNEAVNGGGIYVANGSQGHTNIGSNSSSLPVFIKENTATGTGGTGGMGGGIYLECGGHINDRFTLKNFELTDNTASGIGKGGGAYLKSAIVSGEVHDHTAMTISNGTVSGNTAYHGGGIYFDHHDADITNVTFDNHTVIGNGGGVFINGHSNDNGDPHEHDFTSCTFTANSAMNGGAVYVCDQAKASFENTNIGTNAKPNTATYNGGGVYMLNSCEVVLNNANVQYNTAGNFGGGVYLYTKAILGMKGAVRVYYNKSTRSSNTNYSINYSGGYRDDVCLHELHRENNGKIKVLGDLAGSKIGITEEQVASGAHRSHDLAGDMIRQFTIDYGDFGSPDNKAFNKDVFESNDNELPVKLLLAVASTTSKLEVTLGSSTVGNKWYVAGITDDNNQQWGFDDNTPLRGLFPDLPRRTLIGPNGVFAQEGFDPENDHIFVVRSLSAFEEAEKRTTNGKAIIRYPNSAFDFTSNTPIPDAEGSMEVSIYRYPGGHLLSNSLSDEGGASAAGAVAPGSHAGPGINKGPVFSMDDNTRHAVLRNIHMDGLREYSKEGTVTNAIIDELDPNHIFNPGYVTISPNSALLSVDPWTTNTTITLKEHCEIEWNDNKYADATYAFSGKERRPGGGVYCAGNLIAEDLFVADNNCATNGGGIHIASGGTVSLKDCTIGGDEGDKNTANNKGGGVYKLGTLKVQGEIYVTDNESGTGSAIVRNNVYIPNTASQKHILITDALACGSSIGVTKTKTDHTYDDDDNFPQVRTAIAKNEVNNSGHALDAYHKNVFFDDTDKYGVWSFNYHKTNAANDYSDQNDYFIETWRNHANAAGFTGSGPYTVISAAGLAYFAKQVNTGTNYSGATINQTIDIDLSGHYWEPIGFSTGSDCDPATDYQFSGSYNGNGHIITNAMSVLPAQTMGLFGKVTGTVKHTFAIGGDLAYTHDGPGSLGAVAGEVSGIIDGCEAADFNLNGYAADASAGGIVGITSGEVRNSFSSGITYEGTVANAGGLAGHITLDGAVRNSYSKADVPSVGTNNGALVGKNEGTLNNVYTSADEGTIVGTGHHGAKVYSAGAETATATYTPTIGADHLGYMCIDNGVDEFDRTDLIEGKDYFTFKDAAGNEVELIPLFRLLSLNAAGLGDGYAEWARPALAYYNNSFNGIERPINGDLPLLMLNNYDGSVIGQGGFRSVGTYGGSGDVLQYGGPDRDGTNNELDAALTRTKKSNFSGDDFLFVYGDVTTSGAPTSAVASFTQAKVSIYEHAAITRAGTLAGFNNTYVGITFDNSNKSSGTATNSINYIDNGPSLPRDWHMLSTPVTNAPLGFNYYYNDDNTIINTNTNTYPNSPTVANANKGEYYNNPWGNENGINTPNNPSDTEFSWLGNANYASGHNRYWMHGWDGSRAAGTHDNGSYPANTWQDGYFPSKVNTSAIQFGEQLFIPFDNTNGSNEYVGGNHRYPYGMDFYSWYEPKYHYINFKRNGPNHWHSDAPHKHLDYTPETASNNSGPFDKNVNETTLLDGKGYMASIHIPTFLQTSGKLSTSPKSLDVTYTEEAKFCNGWNLVGNPFHSYLDFHALCDANGFITDNTYVVYNADSVGSTNTDSNSGNYGNGFSYYVMSGSTGGAYAHRYLHPHQGFFVNVAASNDPLSLTFSEEMTKLRSVLTGNDGSYRDDSRPAYPLVNLFLTSDKGCSDVCVVEFNRPEWGGATKLRDMYSGNGMFYAAHDDGNYAALFSTPDVERIPLKFEAKDEAGDTYTIHWNTQNGDFRKLYLVDNITGVQYDMLRNSSYSFSGKKGDYWSRFYITFEVTGLEEEQDDEDDDDSTGTASTTFAFFDGSQWVVTNEAHGTATLDLIDLQGRVLHSTTLAEGQARIGLPDVAKGMYLMRMTNQNGMFVQKIVVR